MNRETVDQLTIHKIVSGSNLYGFATPESDVDIRGVCLSPIESLLGLGRFEQYVETKQSDTTIYELRRFCTLALKANPNILDILFCPPDWWLITCPIWYKIYHLRSSFLSQQVRNTFGGYAAAQLKRIKGHRVWLDDPPKYKPVQEEFGGIWVEDNYVFPHISAEKEYKGRLKRWNQYQSWLKNRNPKRAELERKYGYDTKHGAHLVRLLLQAKQILSKCDFNPILSEKDLEMVVTVKSGGWGYERLLSWVDVQDNFVRYMSSVLPKKANFKAVENKVIHIYANYVKEVTCQIK